jgi:hypothetical protein
MAVYRSFAALGHIPELLALAEQQATMEALATQKDWSEEDRKALRYIAGMISVQLLWVAHAVADALRVEMRVPPPEPS